MKLVANRVKGIHLRDILPVIGEDIEVDNVLAAIKGVGNKRINMIPVCYRLHRYR